MTLHAFLLETLAIFVGDVCAVAFIALISSLAWRLIKSPGFRVGASWTFKGWSVNQDGQVPECFRCRHDDFYTSRYSHLIRFRRQKDHSCRMGATTT